LKILKTGNYLRINDTVTLSQKSLKELHVIKDNLSVVNQPQGSKVLHADIVLSHAGRITGNKGFYLPTRMQEAVSTVTTPYPKPFLLHHDSHSDPIGRMTSGRYVDTSNLIPKTTSQDSLIRKLNDKSSSFINLIDSVADLAKSGIFNDSFAGLGYLMVSVNITDEEAIKKIMDGRYLTVSVGLSTNKAVCSICKTDLVEEGYCEHRPGKEYDGQQAFIICGDIEIEEGSFVNAPADRDARVVRFFNGTTETGVLETEKAQDEVSCDAIFTFKDSLEVNMVVKTDESKLEDKKEDVKQEEAKVEDKKDEQKQEETKVEPEVKVEDKQEEIKQEPKVEDKVEDKKEEPKVEQPKDESDLHYEAMIKFALDNAMLDEDFADAELTPEKRKALKTSTFCKPGDRKYPVPDCAHSRSAMAYAKKYNESASVIACIKRKAAKLGCPFSNDELDTIDAIVKDTQKTEPVVQQVENTVEKCKTCEEIADKVKALEDELSTAKAINEEASKEYATSLAALKETIIDSTMKFDLLGGKKMDDMSKIKDELSALKVDELLKKAQSAKEVMDIDKILKKINDGMSNIPTQKVEDPTLSDANNVDPASETKNKDVNIRFKDAFNRILVENGEEKAFAYLSEIKRFELVPQDFDPTK